MFKTSNFYEVFFENHSVSKIYDIIGYLNNPLAHNLEVTDLVLKQTDTLSFELFPDYLKYNLLLTNGFKEKKAKQKTGFAINLAHHKTAAQFIKDACSQQHRKNVTRAINRLETCFNICYKTYFGDMATDHYMYIMDCLKTMISKRFQLREGRNKTLLNWDHHVNETLDLIKQKKASIFVMYNTDIPIEISINYHVNTIMYSAISSYDLDYGKFSLGNIEIFRQLEWCLANNIDFFDMGYGDFDYKRKWANYIYHFNNHVLYHKYNVLGPWFALLKTYQYRLMEYLISKKINDKIYGILEILKPKKQLTDNLEFELMPETVQSIPNNMLKPIDFNHETYDVIKKPIYDCLYKHQEHIENVQVFEILNAQNKFLIKGKTFQTELIGAVNT